MTPCADTLAVPAGRGRSRTAAVVTAATGAALIAAVAVGAALLPPSAHGVSAAARALEPGAGHLFGTDLLGRDVAARTLAALGTSLAVGLTAAAASTLIAFGLAVLATAGRAAEAAVDAATELALGLPHIVLLLLVAYALGGGTLGVIVAVGLTHWPRLSRVIRAGTESLLRSDFVAVSRRLGRSRLWIARHHLAPHLLPQLVVGFVLIFPHAILHEAGLTFLGVGLEPHLPAIGVMLAEASRSLSAGLWWAALFPGLALMLLAIAFEVTGEALRRTLSVQEAQE